MIEFENTDQVGLNYFVFLEWACAREKSVGRAGLDSGVKGRFSFPIPGTIHSA